MLTNLSRLMLLCFFIAFAVACQKDEEEDLSQTENATFQDMATVSNLFEDTESEVEAQMEEFENNLTSDGAETRGFCATITSTLPPGEYPNEVTIDFGDVGCLGTNGRLRRGKIIVNISGPILESGSVRTVGFEDFYLDNVLIQGTKSLTNQSPPDGSLEFQRLVDGTGTFPDGSVVSYTADNIMTQTAGSDTPIILDDEYEITGTASGEGRLGNTFNAEITDALVKRLSCPWLVDGTINITINAYSGSLDYGDGTCDKFATATLPNGNEFEIKLHKWW